VPQMYLTLLLNMNSAVPLELAADASESQGLELANNCKLKEKWSQLRGHC